MLQKFRFLIIISLLVLIFLPGFARLQELRTRLAQTEADTRKAQLDIAQLQAQISQMKNNQDYLEMVAREKMGIVKKGETVLRMVTEEEAAAIAAEATNATAAANATTAGNATR